MFAELKLGSVRNTLLGSPPANHAGTARNRDKADKAGK